MPPPAGKAPAFKLVSTSVNPAGCGTDHAGGAAAADAADVPGVGAAVSSMLAPCDCRGRDKGNGNGNGKGGLYE